MSAKQLSRLAGAKPARKPRAKKAATPKAPKAPKMSKHERTLLAQLTALGCASAFKREARFHPEHRWRLDFLASEHRLALEVHGGIHMRGRHVRGAAYTEDRIKMNAAAELGITVLEFTPEMLSDGSAAMQAARMLKARGWNGGGAQV
jgi:very-short-patch-repair endonuclease